MPIIVCRGLVGVGPVIVIIPVQAGHRGVIESQVTMATMGFFLTPATQLVVWQVMLGTVVRMHIQWNVAMFHGGLLGQTLLATPHIRLCAYSSNQDIFIIVSPIFIMGAT